MNGRTAVDRQLKPLQDCPGLRCGGSGECVMADYVCDLDVDCLDNGDVKYCTMVNGKMVQVFPPGVDRMTFSEEEVYNKAVTYSPAIPPPSTSSPAISPASNTTTSRPVEQTSKRPVASSTFVPRSDPGFNMSVVVCTSAQFRCLTVDQCIPVQSRCNGHMDCPDKSDEYNCKCADLMLQKFPGILFCLQFFLFYRKPGYPDCDDGSDEAVRICAINQFRCPMSTTCVNERMKCDGIKHCPNGEDELNCVVLVNKNYVPVMNYGDIVKQNNGYLVIQNRGEWRPVCVPKFDVDLANTICSYMGYSGESNFTLGRDQGMPEGFSKEDAISNQCFFVQVKCGSIRCGSRPMFRDSEASQDMTLPGALPWFVAIFVEGEHICDGSIIHESFVVTSVQCALKIYQAETRTGNYITAVAGQRRFTDLGSSPHSQIRRIVKFKHIPGTEIAVGYLGTKFTLTFLIY
ncbi:prolow-density lipoprotein receptor-related protein 1 [Eurytemora carolleeae]|uniref:prolow-density lipoprotein receptor-related protein 1 n=1 Tax=Eurytemora carolleeae TaxID=1294199 RepID=UPI000C761EC2|nr:prolow-density lipoprotein receptor-related protein 1 [Eurytemora carolleeae]|eukprot:XP_023343086.1 prolow-density lipoprotein receptor-related protein 1-like [Eurytemora affinis]